MNLIKSTSLLFFLVFLQLASADDIQFAAGTTVVARVTLVADANGVLQIDRTKPIVIGGNVGPTTPTDPTNPNPNPTPVGLELQKLAQQAPQVDRERKAVSVAIENILEVPVQSRADLVQAVDIVLNTVMRLTDNSQDWSRWKDSVVNVLDNVRDVEDLKEMWAYLAKELVK